MTESVRFHHVLLDTGPLVAIRNPNDSEHAICVAAMQRIQPPLLTCWPVITEAAWMLKHNAHLVRRIFKMISHGAIAILDIGADEVDEVDTLYAQYADLSPQLADLALLHLAQREGLDTIFTLDRRDFSVFRLRGRKRLRLLPESS